MSSTLLPSWGSSRPGRGFSPWASPPTARTFCSSCGTISSGNSSSRSALPQQRYIIDGRRLAAALADATPAPRVSPWYGYSPLDPAHLASNDGIVFVKDTRRS